MTILPRTTLKASASALALFAVAHAEVPWKDVLTVKTEALESAAQRAVEQQRIGHFPDQPLKATYAGAGNVEITETTEWDADGDGKAWLVEVTDIPHNHNHKGIPHKIEVRFDQPINVLENASGFALWVKTPEGLSEDLRVGLHLKVEGEDADPIIFADTPIVQRFGDNPHLLYFDWGYVFDNSLGVFKTPPREFFEKVTGFDLVIVQKRLPFEDGLNLEPTSGEFIIDGLALVDWLDGTYDNSRAPSADVINKDYPIVLQGRTQQVALIAAQFGGDEGVDSAIRAMDMMARIQSWDGSWPEIRTRLQGEFTHGMILADLARALKWMREQNRPELEEEVTIRQWTMKRDDLYEQMLYRAAMSRTPGPFSVYRDTYCSGQGSMDAGCNRPMSYAIGQWHTTEILRDPKQREQVMAEYDANMDDLVAAQGSTAGGWPIFGEGNKFQNKGLHFDGGYTTDHLSLMTDGYRSSNDERWAEMLRKFQTVAEVMVMEDGWHFDGAISERGGSKPHSMKAADIIYQEAMRANAPIIAQWGANFSEEIWSNWPNSPSVWPGVTRWRGYPLGAFLTWQVYDMQESPEPQDLGYVFPRQWPVWTAVWMNKQGEEVRESQIIAKPDGMIVNTFEWAVGQYPVLTAAPILPKATGDVAVEIQPLSYEGNVTKMAADAQPSLSIQPVDGGAAKTMAMNNNQATLTLEGPSRVTITEPDSGVNIVFLAIPREDKSAPLEIKLLREPQPYLHLFASADAADSKLDQAGVNLADPSTGTSMEAVNCYPNAQYGLSQAIDGNPGTSFVIGRMKGGTALKFNFPQQVALDKVILTPGDHQETFQQPKDITLVLSDGTKQQVSLPMGPGKSTTVFLDGARSESLLIQIDSIHEAEGRQDVGGWAELAIVTASPKGK